MDAEGRDLPAGLVTFVFTDIEGSTRLVRTLGDAYVGVLDRHREILRDSWRRHGGHEVGTEGDSFFVAFGDQSVAIAACVEGQRALARERWPPAADVRVRMGIHTGLAVPRGPDYVAFAVHQAARIVNTGHGGQIVVSADAANGVQLPQGTTLRSLGTFRVRDFDDPVELWQAQGDGLDDDFPALRAVPADHHNLTSPMSPILGRDAELDHVAQLMRPSKAVTLVGPGGVGKTRLAVEHGLRSLDDWPDGVWFVDLAALGDGGLVAAAVAAALGVRTPADSDALTEVVNRLAGKHALLIFDNVEHVREAAARAVATILQRNPRVGILTTSREPLGWRGESVVRVGPLSWEDAGADAAGQPAVQLFLERVAEAGATRSGEPEAIAELCRHLDGLPLAIEMAVARAGVLTPGEILSGLADSAGSIASRDPTLSARHRSLDELLSWSDRLLTEAERGALRRLAVFVGPFGYETATAAAVATAADAHLVPDLVWSLANKSLLNIDPAAGGTCDRFSEIVRTFARRHDPDRELPAASRRLAVWYLDRIGPTCTLDQAWVARMGEEIDNIRGLIAVVAGEDQSAAQRLAWSIGRYHDLVQGYRHGIDELARHTRQLHVPTPSRVGLLTLLADMRLSVGDGDLAVSALDEARALQQVVGPAPWDDVVLERTEGELALRAHDYDGAIHFVEKVLQRPLSDRAQGRMWNLIGIARVCSGDPAGAAAAFEFELTVFQRLGLEALQVSSHGNVAEALLRCGDSAGAARHQRESLRLALRYGQPLMIVFSLMVAARLAVDEGHWETAVRLQAAADEHLTETGSVMYTEDRELADAAMAAAAAHLGDVAFEEQRERGRTDDFDALVDLADGLLATVERTRMDTRA